MSTKYNKETKTNVKTSGRSTHHMQKAAYFTVLLCLLTTVITAEAKSLRELWQVMPDSLIPSLNRNLRIEMTDLQDMKVKAEVTNMLGDTSIMDTLTSNFSQVRINRSCTVQLKLLPTTNGDSVICMVKTLAAPERESEVTLYNQQWQVLDANLTFGGKSVASLPATLVQKPDTMSEERFEELQKTIEPKMMSAQLFEHEDAIVFCLSLPLLSNEEKKQTRTIKVQRKFKWNGRIFNKG